MQSSVPGGTPLRADHPRGSVETRLLRGLNEAGRSIHRSLSVEDVLGVATDQARRLTGGRRAVGVLDGRDGRLGTLQAKSPRDGGPPASVAADEVRRTNLPVLRGATIAVPLVRFDGSNVGVIEVTGKSTGPFDEADEAVLVQVAQIASVAIENARLYETAVDARSRLSRAARVERLRAAELHAVIQAIGEAVLVCDAAGTVTLTNPAADRLFADDPVRSADDLLSRFDLSTPDDPLLAAVEVRRRTRPELWVEIRGYAVPGLQTRVDARAEPVDPAGTIYVIRDVTAARAMRAQREAFLGILSHELRTPITTIYAGSKVLTREAGLSREGRLELAADISAEAERLYRLVEDLLVMTRAERGVLELVREPVLLQHVVTSAVRLETAHRPGLRIERTGAHDVPAVAGDATYIEQVVRNLLSNAAKYGPAGAPVQLDVASDDREVSVRVLDRGSGFKTAESDDLFELFYRSPATAAQRAGAGIGLFVCRRLVQAMGGRIWARPRAGGGAEFGFALPQFAED